MAREFKETAHLHTDLDKYGENYDHIFRKPCRVCGKNEASIAQFFNAPNIICYDCFYSKDPEAHAKKCRLLDIKKTESHHHPEPVEPEPCADESLQPSSESSEHQDESTPVPSKRSRCKILD